MADRQGIFVSGDLMLGVPVLSAMETVCTNVSRILSGKTLLQRLQSQPVDLLVVDLEANDLDLKALGDVVRQHGRPLTVAYAPHVATARLEAAREAGFAAVLTRGQAASQLPAILASLLGAAPSE